MGRNWPFCNRPIIAEDLKQRAGVIISQATEVYIPELEAIWPAEGKITYPDGHTGEGRFGYIPGLKGVCLVEGKATFLDGHTEEGRWGYIPALNRMCLVEKK